MSKNRHNFQEATFTAPIMLNFRETFIKSSLYQVRVNKQCC
jgi:hypothetical protein